MTENKSIALPLRGDSGSEYECILTAENGRVSLHCTCRAAQSGTLCKHRTTLLSGDYRRAKAAGAPEEQIQEFAAMLEGSGLARAYTDRRTALAKAEKDLESIKKEIAAGKKQLARLLDEGVPDKA